MLFLRNPNIPMMTPIQIKTAANIPSVHVDFPSFDSDPSSDFFLSTSGSSTEFPEISRIKEQTFGGVHEKKTFSCGRPKLWEM
mgnify:CR=1 FL=1